MHYEIHRGLRTGKQLTTAQRSSATFAEEPVVLGKVLRRGSRPMIVTDSQFEVHKAAILRQLLSGSIQILAVDGELKVPYTEWAAVTVPVPDLSKELSSTTVKVSVQDRPKVEDHITDKLSEPVKEESVEEEPEEELDTREEA